MCGITALWRPSAWSDEEQARLVRMRDAIAHRGPDEAGAWIDAPAGLGLGHRRLSILDLSPTGSQPMRSQDGRWTIAFNGEVYNFLELKRELSAAGVAFRGTSDTEALVEGIARWGVEAAVRRAAGMFAFAAWDARDRALHLGRDRMGEKPLYYGWVGDRFVAGSELKALTASGLVDAKALDRDAIAQLVRYSCIRAPRTIYAQLRKLPPASLATVKADRTVTVRPYWSLSDVVREAVATRSAPGYRAPTFEESIDRLEARLSATVGEQMMTDVPHGALLSGGIDSSLVVALMAKASARPVRTFSIGFNEAGYDEATHAKAVAAHLGTDHTELYVRAADSLAVIPELAGIYDEPFADASQIPTLLVSRLARTQVTVALTGDGGDETFGGYERYFNGDRLWRKVSHLPLPVRKGAAWALRAMPLAGWRGLAPLARLVPSQRATAARLGDRAYKVATLLGAGTRAELYDRFCSHWAEDDALVIGAPKVPSGMPSVPAGLTGIEEMMVSDALSYLPDDVLVKVDRASMSTSLETRAPLLDHRVAELAWTMPLDQRVAGAEGKRVLRALLYRHVPRELVDRPKMGFSVPIDSWLRGELRAWAEDLLDETALRRAGWLHPEPIRRAWKEHLAGRANAQYALWNVLMFQGWLAR